MEIEPKKNKHLQIHESLLPYDHKSSSSFHQNSSDQLDFLKIENNNIKLED